MKELPRCVRWPVILPAVKNKTQWKNLLLSLATGLLICSGAWFWWPFSTWLNGWIPGYCECKFLKWTGFPCITCGGTRSAYYFVHGMWWKSFCQNAGVFSIFLVMTGVLINVVFSFFRKKDFNIQVFLNNILLLSLTGIFLIQWLIKIIWIRT
jgi:hypothetical protein